MSQYVHYHRGYAEVDYQALDPSISKFYPMSQQSYNLYHLNSFIPYHPKNSVLAVEVSGLAFSGKTSTEVELWDHILEWQKDVAVIYYPEFREGVIHVPPKYNIKNMVCKVKGPSWQSFIFDDIEQTLEQSRVPYVYPLELLKYSQLAGRLALERAKASVKKDNKHSKSKTSFNRLDINTNENVGYNHAVQALERNLVKLILNRYHFSAASQISEVLYEVGYRNPILLITERSAYDHLAVYEGILEYLKMFPENFVSSIKNDYQNLLGILKLQYDETKMFMDTFSNITFINPFDKSSENRRKDKGKPTGDIVNPTTWDHQLRGYYKMINKMPEFFNTYGTGFMLVNGNEPEKYNQDLVIKYVIKQLRTAITAYHFPENLINTYVDDYFQVF